MSFFITAAANRGPFGDHTGFYTLEEPYPVFHVTVGAYRKNPIYQTTIVGRPPMEDCWMGWAIIRITPPVPKRQFPEIMEELRLRPPAQRKQHQRRSEADRR